MPDTALVFAPACDTKTKLAVLAEGKITNLKVVPETSATYLLRLVRSYKTGTALPALKLFISRYLLAPDEGSEKVKLD
jgi:hypothetical protein